MGFFYSVFLIIIGTCFGFFILKPNDMVFSAPWFYLIFIFSFGFVVGRFGTIIEFLTSTHWKRMKDNE